MMMTIDPDLTAVKKCWAVSLRVRLTMATIGADPSGMRPGAEHRGCDTGFDTDSCLDVGGVGEHVRDAPSRRRVRNASRSPSSSAQILETSDFEIRSSRCEA
jgi:hypothetical protein